MVRCGCQFKGERLTRNEFRSKLYDVVRRRCVSMRYKIQKARNHRAPCDEADIFDEARSVSECLATPIARVNPAAILEPFLFRSRGETLIYSRRNLQLACSGLERLQRSCNQILDFSRQKSTTKR